MIKVNIFFIFLLLMFFNPFYLSNISLISKSAPVSYQDIESNLILNQKSLQLKSEEMNLNYRSFYDYNSSNMIRITSNADFLSKGFPGSGTESNPIIINNYEIKDFNTTTLGLLQIENTNLHFVIKNNYFHNGWIGIRLNNVENGIITNNVIHTNIWDGIAITESSNLTITNNTIFNNEWRGIPLWNCLNIVIDNNTIYDNDVYGILTFESENITLTNNLLYNNEEGISVDGNKFLVQNNSVENGMYIYGSENQIVSNQISGWIYLIDAYSIEIKDNILTNSTFDIQGSSFGDFCSHEIMNNLINGIPLRYYVNMSNQIIDSGDGQLIIANSNNLTIKNQQIKKENTGILIAFSNNLLIEGSILTFNGRAISLISTNNSLFQNNYLFGNLDPITLLNSNNNTFQYNTYFVDSNTIDLSDSYNNSFNSNNFIYSYPQSDFGKSELANSKSPSFNINEGNTSVKYVNFHLEEYGNNFTGNFWDIWVLTDNNIDGYVDEPNIFDSNPLTKPTNTSLHILTRPNFLYPNIRYEIVNKSSLIEWLPAFDTQNHDVTYDIYYSLVSKNIVTGAQTRFLKDYNWTLLKENMKTRSIFWNINSLENNSFYLLKVVAKSDSGLINIDYSDNWFIIQTFSKQSNQSKVAGIELATFFLGIIALLIRKKYTVNKK